MKKSIENLATSKITGGRRRPLRSRRKYEMNRFPNEVLLGEPVMVTRKVRGKNIKTALKTVNFVNLAVDSNRSEERRVGKECRSRWSPYH